MKRLLPILLALALLAGCAPDQVATTAEVSPQIPNDPNVYTDWSQLTPYEPFVQVARRWENRQSTELIPSPDYGTLVPFVGATDYYTPNWTDYDTPDGEEEEDSEPWEVDRYGLMTLDGQIVVEAVYESISSISIYNWASDSVTYLPLWYLRGTTRQEGEQWVTPFTIAAQDGSWAVESNSTDGDLAVFSACEDGILVTMDGALVMLNLDGTQRFRWTEDDMPQVLRDQGFTLPMLRDYMSWSEGVGCIVCYGCPTFYVDAATGQWLELPEFEEGREFSQGLAAVCQNGLWGYIDRQGDWVIPPSFLSANPFWDDKASVCLANGCEALIDPQGDILTELDDPAMHLTNIDLGEERCYLVYGETEAFGSSNLLGWYDSQMNFTALPQGEGKTAGWVSGLIWWKEGDTLTVVSGAGTHTLPAGLGTPVDVRGELLLLDDDFGDDDSGDDEQWALADLNGNVLVPFGEYRYLYFLSGEAAGADEILLHATLQDGSAAILDEQGQVRLTSLDGYIFGYKGVFQVSDDVSFGCKNLDGQWLLRLSRFQQGED